MSGILKNLVSTKSTQGKDISLSLFYPGNNLLLTKKPGNGGGKGPCEKGLYIKQRQKAVGQAIDAISEAEQVAVSKKNGCFDGLTNCSKNVFNQERDE